MSKGEVLTVTKQRVLEAADRCSSARETLETMFPEAFEDSPLVKTVKEIERDRFLPFAFVVDEENHDYVVMIRTDILDKFSGEMSPSGGRLGNNWGHNGNRTGLHTKNYHCWWLSDMETVKVFGEFLVSLFTNEV